MNTSTQRDRQLIAQARAEAAALKPFAPQGDAADGDLTMRGIDSSDLPRGYQIVRMLRTGGQAAVYEARDERTGERLAIKILRHEGPGVERESARLEREARLLARLDHPNLVRICNFGELRTGRFFAVMEYIDGQSIDRYAAEMDLSPSETVTLFIKVAEAVGAAHLRGIIHRDLKPSNILVDSTGEPRVLDFGLARTLLDSPEESLTQGSGFVGTLAWASPEQVQGRSDDLDLRTDVYSLGAVLYLLLTGQMPCDTDLSIRDATEAIVSCEPVRPRAIRRTIPRSIETIVLKCLSKDRARRYNSANELAADLRRALAGEAIEAQRDSALHLAGAIIRRHKLPAAIASLFLMLGLSSGAIMGGMYTSSQQQLNAAQQENQQLRAELAKIKHDLVEPGNWTSAFTSGQAISRLSPEEGWQVVQAAWGEMTDDHPKQQLLKAMAVGTSPQPEFLVHVLHLGVTDPSPPVQNWAFTYLRDIAFLDFAEDFSAYGPWFASYKDMPLEQVRRENLRRFAEDLRHADNRTFDRNLEMLARSWVLRNQPDLIEVLNETNLTEHLLQLLANPATPDGRHTSAGSVLSRAALDEVVLRERIIPLLGDEHHWKVRSAAARILQMHKPPFAVPALLQALTDAVAVPQRTRGLDLWAIAQALGEIGDPAAIPTMIAAINTDNTYDTIYGIGYFGLGKITGVRYDEAHDGAWWRAWWERNNARFADDVQQLQIPDLPPRPGSPQRRRSAAPTAPQAPDAGDIPVERRAAGDDEQKTYILTGPHQQAEAPEGGWHLLLILPGGDGSANFQPFVNNIYREAVPQEFLQAQLIAPQWSDEQSDHVVWPTRALPWEEARFTTEEFIEAVIADIAAQHTIDRRHIYALGWSSGGPPLYAAATDPDSSLTGAFIAMSVFHPQRLDLEGARGRAFYILHSPEDFINMRFPQAARDQLAAVGAVTKLETYEGGHGWHGDVFGNIRDGIEWLQQQGAAD